MPFKGNMDTSSFEEIRKPGDATRSANPTKVGLITRKDGTKKKWVQKILKSRQEVLVECMTGEMYRYLIGPQQPKIRTGGENEIMSEFTPYRAVRDIIDVSKNRHMAAKYKAAFQADLHGFAKVLFSSIVFEENDLSDQNYGLAITRHVDGDAPDTFDEDYGEFLKIDHGQSLNSMRVSGSLKKYAEIKYYPPPTQAQIDPYYGIDKRTKKARSTIWFTARKYEVTPYFIDRCLLHFLLGAIDKDYILGLNYQPATLPLFDGRLLPFFAGLQGRYDLLEEAKYRAIAAIVFTPIKLFASIGSRASYEGMNEKREEILQRVKRNRDALFEAIRTDLDFCVYCAENAELIRQDLQGCLRRMTHKREREDREETLSERYGDLAGREPVDDAALNPILKVGKHYAGARMRDEVAALLLALRNTLADHDWKVSGTGGLPIPIRPGQTKTLPETASAMALACMRWNYSPRRRLFRTLHDLTYLANVALQKKSAFRTKQTQRGYENLRAMILDFCTYTSAIKYFWKKYEQTKAERFIDLYRLADEIDTFILLKR
jgi:hypothetical protein